MNYLSQVSTNVSVRCICIFLFLTTYYLLLSTPPKAFAQDKGIPPVILSVSPVLLNISLSPDQTISYPITLTNQLSTPLLVQTTFADFRTASEDGGYEFVQSKTDPLLSWTSIDKDTFFLQPNEKTAVTLTVKTPKTIPFGGYYGMVYFEPILPTAAGQTKILPKIAVLILGSVGVSDPNQTKAEIATFSLPTFLQQDSVMPLLLRVKNSGINHFSAKPFVSIISLTGKETTYQLEEKYVFPGKVRRWEQDLDTTLFPGVYTVQAAVSTGGGKQVFLQTTVLVYPNTITLLILTLLILLILIGFYRSRVKKAIEIMLYDKTIPEAKPTNILNKKTKKRKVASKKREKNP